MLAFSNKTSADIPNMQLESVCADLGIPIITHDAWGDSIATLNLWIRQMRIEDRINKIYLRGVELPDELVSFDIQ